MKFGELESGACRMCAMPCGKMSRDIRRSKYDIQISFSGWRHKTAVSAGEGKHYHIYTPFGAYGSIVPPIAVCASRSRVRRTSVGSRGPNDVYPSFFGLCNTEPGRFIPMTSSWRSATSGELQLWNFCEQPIIFYFRCWASCDFSLLVVCCG